MLIFMEIVDMVGMVGIVGMVTKVSIKKYIHLYILKNYQTYIII